MKVLVFLALVALAASASVKKTSYDKSHEKKMGANAQSIYLYDYTNQGGSSAFLNDYAPRLSNYNFDNRASSACFNGIWLLYEKENYERGGASYYGWGENYCTNLDNFDNKASSARYAGAPDGYKYNTINFYAEEGFMGNEQYYYGDAPNINNRNTYSIVVTGCSPWTIYELTNYGGQHACVYPSDTTKCSPGFFLKSSDFGNFGGHIQSTRIGCFSKNILTSRPVPKNGFVSHKGIYIPEDK